MKYVNNILITIAAGAVLFCNPAAAQTQINLSSQGRNIDFRNAPSTSPLKSGTTLPAVCQTAEMFFKTDAAPGSNVFLCVAPNTWQVQASGGGGISLTVQQNTIPMGSRSTLDALDGAGITRTFTDTGYKITDQISVNTAVIPTRVSAQSNADRVVMLSSSSTCAFIGALNPAPIAYPTSAGMEIHFTPNNTCTASGSLALNGLGAINLYEADGVTAISLSSGQAYELSWDPALNVGAGGWKKLAGGGGTTSASDLTSGTLSPARLPLPTTTTLGGTRSLTCPGTTKLSAIGTDGIPVCTADVSITSASDLTSGTLAPDRLPMPTPTTLGGIQSITCSGTEKLSQITAAGVPVCTADAGPPEPGNGYIATLFQNTALVAVGTAGTSIRVMRVLVPVNTTVSEVNLAAAGTFSGGTCIAGLYTLAGAKLFDTGNVVCSASTNGTRTAITPVLVPRGSYYIAWATNSTSVTMWGVSQSSSVMREVFNGGSAYPMFGSAGTWGGSGVPLPSTLGTINSASIAHIPLITMLP